MIRRLTYHAGSNRSDLCLLVSSYERELLLKHYGFGDELRAQKISLSPLFYPTVEGNVENSYEFENRHHFVSIGSFPHRPNRDSLQWLSESIWPKIKKEVLLGFLRLPVRSSNC